MRSVAGDQGGQGVDPVGAGGEPAQVVRGDGTAGGQDVQFRQHLAGGAGPQVDQAADAFGDAQGALDDRVGGGAVADVVHRVVVALEGGAGDGGTQAGLGGDLAAVLAQGPVAHRGVDVVPGLGQGGSDVGKIEQGGEWIHVHTVAGDRGCAKRLATGKIRAVTINNEHRVSPVTSGGTKVQCRNPSEEEPPS